MRLGIHLHIEAQFIAAHDTTRRMHEVHVTGVALGIKRPLHDERPAMRALDEARAPASFRSSRVRIESQPQVGLPAGDVA